VLQALQDRYGAQGLRVLGFPCNDFAAEEPDDLDTIKAFCAREFGATYELFGKLHIKGPRGEAHPLYQWLTSASGPNVSPGPVSWNFEKFLIDRTGHVIGRWPPKTQPDDPVVLRTLEAALSHSNGAIT
jgi:glutathione peroxidase